MPYASLGLTAADVTDPWGNVIQIITNDNVASTGTTGGSGLFIDKTGAGYTYKQAYRLISYGPDAGADTSINSNSYIEAACVDDDICEVMMIGSLISKMVDAGMKPYIYDW